MTLNAVSVSAVPRRRDFRPRSRFGAAGVVAMVVVHAVIAYALMQGLGRHAMEVLKRPLTASLIEELRLPPPPPPPPPRRVVEPPRAAEPAPPAYVPPPDAPAPSPIDAPSITAVQTTAAVAAPPPSPTPAPPAVMAAPPARQDIALVCPRQARPAIPERALDEGISGSVRTELRIRGGKVVDVQILSGPRVFHAAVRAALAQYQCLTQGNEDILATQQFDFKVE